MNEKQLQLITELIAEMIYLDRLKHNVDARSHEIDTSEGSIHYIKKELLEKLTIPNHAQLTCACGKCV